MTELTTNLKDLIRNITRVTKLGYEIAGNMTIWYYLTALLGGIMPVVTAFIIQRIINTSFTSLASANYFYSTFGLLTVLIFAYFLKDILYYTSHYQYLDYIFRNKLQVGLNTKYLDKISQLDMQHLEDPDTQDLIAKVKDTYLVQITNFMSLVGNLFAGLIGIVTVSLSLIVFNSWLPLIIISVSIPRGVWKLKNGKFAWSMFSSGAPELKKLGYLKSVLGENGSIIESKIFQSRQSLMDKTIQTQDRLYELNKKPIDRHFIGLLIISIFEFAVLFLILNSYLPALQSGAMAIGTFIFLNSMNYSLLADGSSTLASFSNLFSQSLYIDDYFKLQELPKLITEKPNPITFEEIKPPLIEFKNVSFNYPKGEPILKNLSFTIHPGETVALVGVNGAGKSTIIKLLCRFYDVTEGQILINGVDLRDLSLSNWYQHLGTLFQHFIKYQFTVKENIMLGNSSIYDEDKMKLAAKQSGAVEFIDKFEKGYEQMLGKQFEDGQELSGGQWQKLAIARAFYEQAPVLIMDEPTSAIDAEAEQEIFENLLNVYQGKTLLLVSHRFSTVRKAEKIIVLDQGQIIESGAHTDLMKNPQKYAKMFNAQAKGYL